MDQTTYKIGQEILGNFVQLLNTFPNSGCERPLFAIVSALSLLRSLYVEWRRYFGLHFPVEYLSPLPLFPSQNSKLTSENLWMSTCHDKGSEGSDGVPSPGGPCHTNVIAVFSTKPVTWACCACPETVNCWGSCSKWESLTLITIFAKSPWHVEAVRSNIAKD